MDVLVDGLGGDAENGGNLTDGQPLFEEVGYTSPG
jgi:hypothetical protein